MMVEVYRSEAGFLSFLSFLSLLLLFSALKESFTRLRVLAKEVEERVLAASEDFWAMVALVFWELLILVVMDLVCFGCRCCMLAV